MKTLPISTSLSFPIDAATQTFAFIGRKGSGKTYGCGRLVELLINAGHQVIILDTVGNWYGLRLAADGKSAGIDIPILGGLRGDIPLEATGGALIADVVVDTGRSMIIDASQFSKEDRQKFATTFGRQLWKRKKAQRNPSPIHLVLEECQLIVPQFVGNDQAQMVGVYEEIVRLGRNYGIGVTMITQRPQSVNKEVLNQTECLMVFQVNGAHERKALKEWIVNQGVDAINLLNELPALRPGECYCWSPQWLMILQKITISPKWTFDSTATPKPGAVQRRGEFKALDLSALQERMQETIEKAKADDPRELKKRIAELEKQLKGRTQVPVLKDKQLTRVERICVAVGKSMVSLKEFEEALKAVKGVVNLPLKLNTTPMGHYSQSTKVVYPAPSKPTHPKPSNWNHEAHASKGFLPIGEEKILSAVIQFPEGLDRKQLIVLCGYKQSARDTYISRLSQRGFVTIGVGKVFATAEGIAALPNRKPLPEGVELREYWLNRLPRGEKAILGVLIEHYPNEVTRDQISEAVGYKQSARDTYLSRMTSKQIIVIGRGTVKASENLF